MLFLAEQRSPGKPLSLHGNEEGKSLKRFRAIVSAYLCPINTIPDHKQIGRTFDLT